VMIELFLRNATPLDRSAIERIVRAGSYPGLVPVADHEVVFQIAQFEGCGQYRVWTLARTMGNYHARRTRWDRPADFRPGVTTPTTFGADSRMIRVVAEDLINKLSAIVLAPFQFDETGGLDGVHYAVSRGTIWSGVALWWWCEAPRPWQQLESWTRHAVLQMEHVLSSESRGEKK
jgi:hypothetical protein